MTADGRYLAELERAEAELLSSRDSHEVIAGRIGSSPGVVRSYCNHLVQRSRLGRCTHVQDGGGNSGQQPSSDPYPQQEDLGQYQGQQYPAQQLPFGYQQPYGQQPPRNPYDRPDPGRWQGQPSWQDQVYQGQPLDPPQQPYGQPSQPSFAADPQYGPPPGQPAARPVLARSCLPRLR
jgi:hypothetical protein